MMRLAETFSRLRAALAARQGLEIHLLREDQIFISKNLIRDVAAEPFKSPNVVPGTDGYTIYIRSSPHEAESRPQQRWTPPVQPDTVASMLRMDRESLSQSWELRSRDDQRISISVRCGSAGVVGEVDGILAVINRVLPTSSDS